MKDKLFIVTGNSLKFREISLKLNDFFDCEQKTIPEYFEVQGTQEEILRHKLLYSFSKFKGNVLVDETSLHFESLNGFPGPYIKYFLKVLPPYDMGKKFIGDNVSLFCHLGFMKSQSDYLIISEGIYGTVSDPKVKDPGDKDFDVFFQVLGMDKPLIDFSEIEKNEFSHRGKALDKLIDKLFK
jgi:non-canonical purine NTP pyrophosphatase (RdgB/HAM1 family)